jgi:hypothetical protein
MCDLKVNPILKLTYDYRKSTIAFSIYTFQDMFSDELSQTKH